MKSKILSLISLSILSLVLLASFASASLTVENFEAPETVAHNAGSLTVTFDLTNDAAAEDLTWSFVNNSGVQATGISSNIDSIAEGTTEDPTTVSITLTINFEANQIGDFDVDLTGTGSITSDFSIGTIDTNVPEDKSLLIEGSSIDEDENETIITVTNDGNVDLGPIQLTAEEGDFNIDFKSGTNFDDGTDRISSLDAGDSVEITVDVSDVSGIGTQSVPIVATLVSDTSITDEDQIEVEASYCGLTPNYESLDINIKDITVKEGFGDDEDYWYPFDIVEIEIEVANDGNYDMEDIAVEWALYTSEGKKITDDEESDFNLDSDDENTITITIRLDDDVDELEGVDEVVLYARAKGKIDDKDSSHDGDATCAEDKETIDLITDDDFVVLSDFEINGLSLTDDLELTDTVSCGSEIQIVGDVWNIGDDDQDDVTVLIKSEELGISKKLEIGDIDSFDYENLDATITIPQDIEAKYYILEFRIYDEDNDIFETDEDDEAALFKVLIHVEGNCEVSKTTSIAANLVTASPQAGEKMTVKATIKNTGDTVKTYILNVEDYSGWATFEELESNSLTLVGGEEREVTLTFDLKKDASGEKTFNIEVVEGSTVTKQPVKVTIAPQKSLLGNFSLPEDNLYLWIIGIVNVILILAIIFVAVRLSKD